LGNFFLKTPNFEFFSLRVNKNLIGRVKKYLSQRRVRQLFAAGKSMLGLDQVKAHLYLRLWTLMEDKIAAL